MWPVGAVSKMTWSNSAVCSGVASTAVNSLNAAISTVHAPESCSSMLAIAESGSTPRYGPTARSLNAAAAASGSRFDDEQPLDARHRRRLRAGGDAEHVVEVRGRVGRDDERPLARVGERDRDRAGGRRFPDPAFAGEEQVAGVPARPVERGQ